MSDDSSWQPPAAGSTPPPPPPPSLPPRAAEPSPPPAPGGSTPLTPPTMGGAGSPPAPPGAPEVDVEPTPAPKRRNVGLIATAVIGVVAIGGAGAFAATQMGGDGDGGSDSPEALGQEVFDAIGNEDVLGMIDLLMPAERDLFRQPAIDFVDELSRLEVLSPAADLAGIEGVDFEVSDTSVDVTPTNVSDIANIALSAQITGTIDGEALPIGDLVFDYAEEFGGEKPDTSALDTTESTEFDLPFTAVEVDGRWYLSVFFTAAEQARAQLGADVPETGIEPRGGDTPEDALDAVIDAVEQLDLSALIASMNPGDAAALQRYAPLFIDDAQAQLDTVDVTIDVTESEYTISGDGDTRHASIDRLVVHAEAEGSAADLTFDHGCLLISADGEEIDTCALAEQGSEVLDEMIGESPELEALIDVVEETFDDYDQPGITLHQHEGQWYVSPIGTYSDQVLAVLRALDREEIDRLVDVIPPAIEAIVEDVFGSSAPVFDDFDDLGSFDDLEDFGDDDGADASAPTTVVVTEPLSPPDNPTDEGAGDDTAETVPGEGEDASATTLEEFPGDDCYAADTGTEAADCFATVIAAGEMEPFQVTAELRFPECGMADAYWEGYFLLDDAEFFELVDPARACFVEKLEQGLVEEYELGYEYTKPDCFEGRNWYSVTDDPAYDDRFAACVLE